MLLQRCKPLHYARGRRVRHHACTHGAVRSVDRNIQRAYPAPENTVELFVIHVCKADIVAHYERKPPVVVLKMQRIASALGHLVYKTEYAFVFAASHLAHQPAFKIYAKRFVFLFINFCGNYLAAFCFQLKRNVRFCRKLFVIYNVLNVLAVYTQQEEAGFDAQLLRYGIIVYCYYSLAHINPVRRLRLPCRLMLRWARRKAPYAV